MALRKSNTWTITCIISDVAILFSMHIQKAQRWMGYHQCIHLSLKQAVLLKLPVNEKLMKKVSEIISKIRVRKYSRGPLVNTHFHIQWIKIEKKIENIEIVTFNKLETFKIIFSTVHSEVFRIWK